MRIAITFFFFLLAMALAFPVLSQIAEPMAIPSGLADPQRSELERERTALVGQAGSLSARIEAFNGKYASIPENSPLVPVAEHEMAMLEKDKKEYADAVEKFNATVKNSGNLLQTVPGVKAAAGAPPAVTGKALAWEDKKHPERSAWSDELRRAIQPNIRVLEPAADIAEYAPNYASLSESQRLDVWASLFVAIAKYESPGFKTDARYIEKKISDGQGKLVAPFASVGLLMISYKEGEQRAYHYEHLDERAKSLEDPLVNLRCGVKVLTHWVKEDGVIAAGSEKAPRGGARYWSVLREGEDHHLDEIREMVKKQALAGSGSDAQ